MVGLCSQTFVSVVCMIIPNAERAVVDVRKLRDYCLNRTHDQGKHKARLFEYRLGMTPNDAEELRRILWVFRT